MLAGPYCTMVLADLGADVVKVERPEGGDETRSWGPPFAGGEAAYYLSVNRDKRSCALDLSQHEGRALALELCARADIVIENFKVGGRRPARRGLRRRCASATRASSTARSPASAPSATPPGRPGYDFVAQAETGLMSITGPEEGPPYKVGVALVDVLTGLHAAAAVLAALHGGEGARIEVPLLDSGLAGLVNVAQNALVTGREPERHGNAHPNIVPYQDFETSSGRIAVAAANDGLFRALCSVHGPRRSSARTSASPRTPAGSSIEGSSCRCSRSASASAPRRTGCADLDAAGVPGGQGALGARRARRGGRGRPPGDATRVDHPTAGPLELVASPIWGATRTDPTPPPLLGEHTAEVLGELGRSERGDRELAARGVVAASARLVRLAGARRRRARLLGQ